MEVNNQSQPFCIPEPRHPSSPTTMPSYIQAITAAERLDSRGKPTVQVVVTTGKGRFTSLVPSGASKGDYEAIELRDGDGSRYDGNGVTTAVKNVKDILGPELVEARLDVTEQNKIDELMLQLDGTDDKSKLGANAILGVSMAVARAGAAARVRYTIRCMLCAIADRIRASRCMSI